MQTKKQSNYAVVTELRSTSSRKQEILNYTQDATNGIIYVTP